MTRTRSFVPVHRASIGSDPSLLGRLGGGRDGLVLGLVDGRRAPPGAAP